MPDASATATETRGRLPKRRCSELHQLASGNSAGLPREVGGDSRSSMIFLNEHEKRIVEMLTRNGLFDGTIVTIRGMDADAVERVTLRDFINRMRHKIRRGPTREYYAPPCHTYCPNKIRL